MQPQAPPMPQCPSNAAERFKAALALATLRLLEFSVFFDGVIFFPELCLRHGTLSNRNVEMFKKLPLLQWPRFHFRPVAFLRHVFHRTERGAPTSVLLDGFRQLTRAAEHLSPVNDRLCSLIALAAGTALGVRITGATLDIAFGSSSRLRFLNLAHEEALHFFAAAHAR